MDIGLVTLPPSSRAAGARLHLTIWPVAAPRAAVLLAHGFAEYAGRYAHVAARLNAAGFAVYAPDHWGHGWSDGRPGDVPDFGVYLDGMAATLARVRADHPALPRLLIGHSMGGPIALLHLLAHQADYAAAAVSGAAVVPADPPSRALILISRILARLAPRLGVVAFDPDGVCRDPAVLAAYLADPLVYHGKIGARLAAELFDAMAMVRAGAPRLTLPLLIQHGGADAVTAPAGSEFLAEHAGSAAKLLKIYPGLYHEIYNEPERDMVLDDLVGWLDRHIAAGRA